MAHWAEIDENNIVIRVTVGDNNDLNGDEGYQWLIDNLGGTWIKTSYNTHLGKHLNGGTPLRLNFAGIGMKYDPNLDGFILHKEYDSWILDEETGDWKPPIPKPNDGKEYFWREKLQMWAEPPSEV